MRFGFCALISNVYLLQATVEYELVGNSIAGAWSFILHENIVRHTKINSIILL